MGKFRRIGPRPEDESSRALPGDPESMKVILVANTDWYLYNYRLALARALYSGGYEVALVSPPGRFSALLEEAGFHWICWPVGRQSINPWHEISAMRSLARIYTTEYPDLVHQFTIKPVLYGSLAARFARVPAIINSLTGRGYALLSDEFKARLIRPAVRQLYRLAFQPANVHTIFENPLDQQYFIENRLAYAQRSHLIPGVGVDAQKFSPSPEPEGIPIITYAGRMLWDKGVGVLIEASRLLKQRGLAFRLVLVGEPDPGNPSNIQSETIEKWVQDGDAEWWGFQSTMETVYQQSHIVALPSFGEGVPTTLMEAAASARALVATDISGCREVIQPGENGLLVPLRDAPALADALEKLICDPALRQRMGAASRRLALEKFTHETINQQTLAVYQTAFSRL
jgi:glycosyltransferase involved in cell wall biosynthesis